MIGAVPARSRARGFVLFAEDRGLAENAALLPLLEHLLAAGVESALRDLPVRWLPPTPARTVAAPRPG